MRLSPIFLVCTAGLATFAAGQTLTPTVRAQSAAAVPPLLRVSLLSLHAKRTAGGTELTGRIKNTGRQDLAYTSVVLVFTDASGREVGQENGYLLAGPVKPGQTAGFRALSSKMPASAAAVLRLREAGQTVTVEVPPSPLSSKFSRPA